MPKFKGFSKIKPLVGWKKLWHDQFFARTGKERVTARRQVDVERARLADYDKAHGTQLLYKWTVENTPSTFTNRAATTPLPKPALKAPKGLKLKRRVRLVRRKPSG